MKELLRIPPFVMFPIFNFRGRKGENWKCRRQKEEDPSSIFVAHYVFDFQFLRSEGGKRKCGRWKVVPWLKDSVERYVFYSRFSRLERQKAEVQKVEGRRVFKCFCRTLSL